MGVQIQIVESLGYAAKLSSNERFTLSCLERLKESFPPAQFTLRYQNRLAKYYTVFATMMAREGTRIILSLLN